VKPRLRRTPRRPVELPCEDAPLPDPDDLPHHGQHSRWGHEPDGTRDSDYDAGADCTYRNRDLDDVLKGGW